MKLIAWIVRIVLFVIVLLFAIKNTHTVDINFYGSHVINNVPLIVAMGISFALALVLDLLFSIPAKIARGHELRKVRKELAQSKAEVLKLNNLIDEYSMIAKISSSKEVSLR